MAADEERFLSFPQRFHQRFCLLKIRLPAIREVVELDQKFVDFRSNPIKYSRHRDAIRAGSLTGPLGRSAQFPQSIPR
jgi:hypothetical protein